MPQHGLLSRILNPIAYHGCDKCMQEGIFVNRRMTFPEANADLQKDDEFNSMTDEAHHRGSMPLSALPTGLVTSFVFDYMHSVCLGVMRKLVKFWLGGPVHSALQH